MATIENSYGCTISDPNFNEEQLKKFIEQGWKVVEVCGSELNHLRTD